MYLSPFLISIEGRFNIGIYGGLADTVNPDTDSNPQSLLYYKKLKFGSAQHDIDLDSSWADEDDNLIKWPYTVGDPRLDSESETIFPDTVIKKKIAYPAGMGPHFKSPHKNTMGKKWNPFFRVEVSDFNLWTDDQLGSCYCVSYNVSANMYSAHYFEVTSKRRLGGSTINSVSNLGSLRQQGGGFMYQLMTGRSTCPGNLFSKNPRKKTYYVDFDMGSNRSKVSTDFRNSRLGGRQLVTAKRQLFFKDTTGEGFPVNDVQIEADFRNIKMTISVYSWGSK
jgi:hypothetical protein